MMATEAIHKLGDISRDAVDLCHVYAEDGSDWIGEWVFGFGFFDVRFPKATTRDLTPEEIETYQGKYIQLANYPPTKLKLKLTPPTSADTEIW